MTPRPPATFTQCSSTKPIFSPGSSRRDDTSTGRIAASSARSLASADRFDDRTDAYVATASTIVPAAVPSDAMVAQSVIGRCYRSSPWSTAETAPACHSGRAVRILLVSDLHYTLRQFDWVVDAAPDFDLVVLAGDHLDIGSSVALDAQIVVVLRYLELMQAAGHGGRQLRQPRSHRRRREGERAALWLDEARAAGIPTDGESLLLDDTLITICPWWDGPLGRKRSPLSSPPTPPAGRRDGCGCTTGRRSDRRRVGPAGGTTATKCSAAGSTSTVPTSCSPATCTIRRSSPTARGPTASATRGCSTPVARSVRSPTRIEIDLDERTATWVSLMGIEEIEPGRPQRAGADRVLTVSTRDRDRASILARRAWPRGLFESAQHVGHHRQPGDIARTGAVRSAR